ncbi:PREDICTED: F-box only protein 10 [Chaetura pelagica]|uniref:F-box only protein 10 n=1 Tax=Chaetura pelagica TaxID=8897 RepID=UPI000523310D|nr:PREDICTED: F-box only protein 10 [Chaetura pelagica]
MEVGGLPVELWQLILSHLRLPTASGYVQFDNCNFESGQLQIQAPGTCQVKFCSFLQSSIHLRSGDTEPGENLRAVKEQECPAPHPSSSGRDSGSSEEEEEEAQAAPGLPCQALQGGRLHALQRDLQLKSLQQELQQDKEAQSLANSLQGCIIRQCLFRDGKGGIFIYSGGQAKLEGSVFKDLTYAVRCIQNSKVIMMRNDIHHCKASGIFLRLSAGGLIADNNIHSNCEAGVDIRKGANPLVLCNKIHSGLRSGIVVVGNGRGIIRSNQIYGNKEAGIYILYNGNPAVSGNHIFQGLAAGIAVNENGRGQITGNVICENQWGGADIRHGGDPILRNNLISCGYSDGVVVGEHGKGLIEGNTICGNKGCGVWMMSSSLPHLINNEISHNSIYGVAVFSHKDDTSDHPPGQGSSESFQEEREGAGGENDPESEEEYPAARHPISVALLELNSINHNGELILQVTKNRIQSFRDYGIALFDEAKGLVKENLIFQGRSKKSILRPMSNAGDCIIQNNVFLTFRKRSDVGCMLNNPPARPQPPGGAAGAHRAAPGQGVSSITRRGGGGCHSHGSIFCTIL